MSQVVTIELDLPDDLAQLQLPAALNARLRELLDRQDSGIPLNELVEVLRNDMEPVALSREEFHGIKNRLMHFVAGLSKPSQDVGIKKVVHSPRPA